MKGVEKAKKIGVTKMFFTKEVILSPIIASSHVFVISKIPGTLPEIRGSSTVNTISKSGLLFPKDLSFL